VALQTLSEEAHHGSCRLGMPFGKLILHSDMNGGVHAGASGAALRLLVLATHGIKTFGLWRS